MVVLAATQVNGRAALHRDNHLVRIAHISPPMLDLVPLEVETAILFY
jgi:hypothetical protein